jgi:hypothetical protein
MTFGDAIEALKRGERVARRGWHGMGWGSSLILLHTDASQPPLPCEAAPGSTGGSMHAGYAREPRLGPHIFRHGSDHSLQPGWLPSQPDILALDWYIVL